MLERLQRLLLLVRCLLAFLWRGKAVRAPEEPSVIVAVLSGKLGDVVCGTPVLRALKQRFPRARVIAAGGSVLAPLLADSGLANEYINIDAVSEVRLRSYEADAAVLTGPSFAPAARLYLAGIPLVVAPRVVGGYCPFETWPYRVLKRLISTYPYRMGEYAPRERLRSLEPLGIVSEDTKKYLGFSSAAEKKVKELFEREGIALGEFLVGVSVTAGNKIKEWPEERFAKVIDHLVETKRARVLLIGGPDDAPRTERTLSLLSHPERVLNAQGLFNIDELKACISKLGLFISVDTGPIYIAEAFNVPTVDIVGPLDEREQPPRGPFNRNVVPPYERMSQLHILNARFYDRAEAERQTLSITVEAVVRETDALVRDLRARQQG